MKWAPCAFFDKGSRLKLFFHFPCIPILILQWALDMHYLIRYSIHLSSQIYIPAGEYI